MDKRLEIINKLKKKKNIKFKNLYLFGLTHTYDHDSNRIEFVAAPYSYDTMNILLAHIQHEGAKISQEYSLDQDEIIEVLEKLYGCKRVNTIEDKSYYKIDLYINWEQFCGVMGEIENIEQIKNHGIEEILTPYIDAYEASQV